MTEQYSFDEKPKRKHSDDPTSWAQAWQSIGIFVATLAVLALVANMVQGFLLGEKLNTYMELLTNISNGTNPVASTFTNYDMTSPAYAIFWIIVGSIFWIIGIFILHSLSHFIATRLGGVGTIPGLIVRSRNWMLICYILLIIGSTIANYFLVNNMVEYLQGTNVAGNSQAVMTYVTDQIMPTYLFYGLMWLIWNIGMSNIIGKYYQLGMGKGCLTAFFLNLALFAMYCGLSVVLTFVLLAAI